MNIDIYIILLILILFITCILYKKKNNKINIISNQINIILPYDIIVVGCAKDIEQYLDKTKEKLIMIKKLFRSCKIIIYENDSKDNTLNILKNWEQEKLIRLITEKNINGLRTERLAKSRQILYNEAMKEQFDLFMVIDLDDVIENLSEKSIISCFELNNIDWAMLGANQLDKYYDLWALRTYDDWMPFDCWKCVKSANNVMPILKPYLKLSNVLYYYCVESRYKKISENSSPIKVKSCFGGCAIYKKEYLTNCSYGNGLQKYGEDNIEICEHVTFNECIMRNGGSIYINPQFINK